MALDEFEDRGEHLLVAEAEVADDVRGEPGDAHEQQREVRLDGFVVAVAPLAQLALQG